MNPADVVERVADLSPGVRMAMLYLLAYEHPDLIAETIARMTAVADAAAAGEEGR